MPVDFFSILLRCGGGRLNTQGFMRDHQERQKKMMELSASAYSAEVATSATKAGSYAVFGKGESSMRSFHS